MSASGSLKPGQVVLGRYALGEHLGKGAFGTVWLADDRTLGRRVALKFVEPHKLAQLRDEAATLAQLVRKTSIVLKTTVAGVGYRRRVLLALAPRTVDTLWQGG